MNINITFHSLYIIVIHQFYLHIDGICSTMYYKGRGRDTEGKRQREYTYIVREMEGNTERNGQRGIGRWERDQEEETQGKR